MQELTTPHLLFSYGELLLFLSRKTVHFITQKYTIKTRFPQLKLPVRIIRRCFQNNIVESLLIVKKIVNKFF